MRSTPASTPSRRGRLQPDMPPLGSACLCMLPQGFGKPACQRMTRSLPSDELSGKLPGVGRSAMGSCSHFSRSALDAWPQHMRHAQSLLSGMCW